MSQSKGLYQTSDKPGLAAYNNNLYLMWKGAGSPGIFTSQSTDQGLTWSPEIRTSGTINSTNGPSFVITPDGTKHFAYRGLDSVGILFYAKSTDFVNWTAVQIDGPVTSTDAPSLANYNNNLYLLWKGSGTDTRIYYSKQDPTTNTWGTQIQLPSTFTTSSGPAYVIAQNGSQHFVYRGTDNGLRYAYRANDTATWIYSSTTIGSSSEKPTLAFDSAGLLHAIWKGISGDNTVWHSVGTFNGTNYVFSSQAQINTGIQTDFGLGLTFLSGRYYLAYKGTDINFPLLLASSVNAQDWQSISRLGAYSIDRPALAFSLNSYLLMWTKSDSSIWRSVSYDLDNAQSWEPQEQINSLIQAQSGPSLAVSDSGLHYLAYQGLNNEVFYSTSTDGETWSDPSPSLGSTGGRPTVAVSGDTAFIMFKGAGTDNAIYLTTNASGTWSTAASIPVVQNTLSGPTLVYNGGQTLHIAFRGTDNYVYYGKSDNSGQNWAITRLPGSASTGDSPILKLYNGKILIFWKGVTGDDQLYYSVCTTQFKDWTPVIQLSPAFKTAFSPAILINNDIVQIAIRGNGADDCLYHTSGSMDIYWSTPYKITGGNSTDSPSVTSYDGNVWAVWKGNGSDVRGWYSVSTTGGNSWGAIVAMNADMIGMTSVPSVLDWANGTWINGPLHFNLIFRASNNNLRYAYSADQTFYTEVISGANSSDGPCSLVYKEKMYVFYKGNSTDTRVYCVIRSWGDNYMYLWNAFQALPSTITTLNRPTAVLSGSVLNLFYRGVDSLIYCAKNNDGANWPVIKRLQGYTSHAPGATNYDGRLCVVWKNSADTTVWFSRSDVNGQNWSDQVAIAGTDALSGPNIAAVNGRLHLVFQKSDHSVYYSMGQDIVTWNLGSSIQAIANASPTAEIENQISQLDNNTGNNKLNDIVIPVKICFNQEIHKLPTIPTTYQSLLKTISSMFGDRLPRKWVLSYIDSQGDNIALSDENDLKALIEDAEKALKTVKLLIFPIDSLTESADYHVIDSDAQDQSMGQTPKPVETLGISQNQVKEAPLESRSELVLHAKKLVKKLTKSDLTQDKREQLEIEYNRLYRDLTQDEIIFIEKHRAKYMEKSAEKEAQRKNELKALLVSLIHEQGLTKATQKSSPQVANQEETKTNVSASHVPQMKKKYPAQVQEKAQMMKNIFGGSSIEELLDFVSKSPNAPLEQLVRTYVSH